MTTGTVANSNLTSLYSNTTSFTSGIVSSSVFSVNAGLGISVNPTTGNVVVTNTGVTSIVAGSNIAITASTGAVTISATGLSTGDVVGPASATDNALARFDTTTGKLIQNSNATLTDAGNLTLTGTGGLFASNITIDTISSIETFTTTTTSTTTVELANTGRTAMTVLVTAVQGANVHCVNVTLLKTGASTAMITTYGEMFNTSSLVNFTADVSGGSARLLITPASATSTVFNAVRTSLD